MTSTSAIPTTAKVSSVVSMPTRCASSGTSFRTAGLNRRPVRSSTTAGTVPSTFSATFTSAKAIVQPPRRYRTIANTTSATSTAMKKGSQKDHNAGFSIGMTVPAASRKGDAYCCQ